MEPTVGASVVKLDSIAVLDESWWIDSIPGGRAVDVFSMCVKWLCHVLNTPYVILILVGVKGNLLLLATGGVHEVMRVQVTTLGIVMSHANSATESDINRHILHRLGVERGLKLRAHESIPVTRVGKAEEVDSEHGHVECDGDDYQAEDSGNHMLGEQTLDLLGKRNDSWYMELTGVTVLASPRRSQSWSTVKLPTHAIVKKPTHFTLVVVPRPRPVIASQNHQLGWNAFEGPCSC